MSLTSPIIPFVAQVPQAVLDDLEARIRQTRWPTNQVGMGWDYGANQPFLQELAAYWVDGFDWRNAEAASNAYPNFTTQIEGHLIHFLHIKGQGPQTVPLLITHGWPGSFLEMLKIIPLLTTTGPVCFDLVIPSVPGFGYSNSSPAPGCDSLLVATLWHQLMQRLGYEQYGVQGGDIGAGIGTWLALTYPASVIGLHLNYIPGTYRPYQPPGASVLPEVIAYQKFSQGWAAREGVYAMIHSTKPLTVAYGLNDSPVGLLAWILEKFYSWSDKGIVEHLPFTKDELLSNVTLYWVTQTIYSSMAIYKENALRPLVFGKDDFVRVPVAFAKFPREIPTPPRTYVEQGYNVHCWTLMSVGGHFAALEQPVLLTNDIKTFFASLK